MSVLAQLIWSWIIFLLFNIMDVFTTYLCLYKLPDALKGKEMNPVFHSKTIKRIGILKIGLMLGGLVLFLQFFNSNPGEGLTAFRAINIVLGLAILNNLYIFIGRKVTGKRLPTPIGMAEEGIKKLYPSLDKWSGKIAYYVVTLFVCIISIGVSLWI